MNDFFNTLGIEATKEEKEIKKAYREKLHTVNPEDDPNGFKILREAYEEALKYARQKEDEKEKRLSPVEDFIFRCEQLYNDFYRRIDEQEWESLFSEDICISLESGEEVRQRFLVFLMEHFRLPAAVWKKIDRTFFITGNRKELLELFPEPYVDFLLQVVRYNGALNYELFEGEVSQDIDDYIEHYHKLRQYADLGMQKEAWQEYELMEEKYTIYHPYTKLEKARLLYSEKEEVKQEEGGTIFRQLAEKYPQEERIVCCYGRYCQEKNQALKYARQKEDEKEKRLSPVEDFIFRCEQLYNDFYRRIDEQEWESLFSEDICISLESGEEVRQRFLVFLMEHFRLPAAVWKKIDRTFFITGNRKELLELFPEPYVDFLLQVVRYNGALNYELFEGEVSQDIDDYIEHYHKLRQYADLGMQKEAWQEYELMEEKYTIYHPYTKLEKARLLYSEKEEVKQEEGGTIFRQLAEKYPQEERIVCCYGRYCQEKNQWDGMIELYDKVLEAHPQSFLARTGRMEAVLQEGRYREAREAILDLLEESPVDERLVADLNKANVYVIAELEPDYKENRLNQDSLMELAWCYYQNSRFEDGIALLDRFVPDESHTLDYHNLKGRIYLTVNEDEKALEHLVLWLHAIQKLRPDGTKKTTRQMARLGYAYYTIASAKADMILDGKEGSLSEVMNDIEKAVAAEKDVSQKVSYYHTAADIWRRKKEYAKMFDICDKMLAIDPQYYPAYLLRQEACLYLGRYQEVVNDYQRATTLYPYHAKPYCTLIRMYLIFGELDSVKDILDVAEKREVNSDELELLRARYIAIRAKNREDLEKAYAILERLEKKGWSLQSEMDEEEWTEISYRKTQILKMLQEEIQ